MMNPVICKMRQGASLTKDDETAILAALKTPIRNRSVSDIVQEGDLPDGLLMVLEGFACRYKDVVSGGRQIVALLVPGDVCDVHASILREMDHSIRTLGPCKIAAIPRSTVNEWVENHPNIRRALEWATLVDEAVLREWLVSLGARNAYVRAAHLFCELHARLEAVGIGTDGGFPLPLNQEDLGNVLGLSAVHTNRVLGRLRDQELVTFRSGVVQTADIHRLRDVAGFRDNYLHQLPRTSASISE